MCIFNASVSLGGRKKMLLLSQVICHPDICFYFSPNFEAKKNFDHLSDMVCSALRWYSHGRHFCPRKIWTLQISVPHFDYWVVPSKFITPLIRILSLPIKVDFSHRYFCMTAIFCQIEDLKWENLFLAEHIQYKQHMQWYPLIWKWSQ